MTETDVRPLKVWSRADEEIGRLHAIRGDGTQVRCRGRLTSSPPMPAGRLVVEGTS